MTNTNRSHINHNDHNHGNVSREEASKAASEMRSGDSKQERSQAARTLSEYQHQSGEKKSESREAHGSNSRHSKNH